MSQTEEDSIDYGDENYKRHKTTKEYSPVFVPEEEKKKCMEFKLFVSSFKFLTVSVKSMLKMLKTYQFIAQCKGVICHPFKTANIIVFDPMKYKGQKVPLQDELSC